MKWNNKYAGILLLCIVAFAFVAGDGIRILQYPPRSFHTFRQSDCLAYTKTYYQHNTGFFSPACYNLLGKDGRVVSEFPVLYYLSAKLCQLFGFQYWIIRGLTVLCYLAGLYYLFLCVRMWIKRTIPALFPVVILATSPFYFYYAVNFLPNVPAISFSFIGLYYLLRYQETFTRRYLLPATTFIVLATLLKPTDGGLIWMAYIGVMAISYSKKKVDTQQILLLIVSSVIVAAGIVSWYLFVKNYNNTYGNNINLQGVYPIWDMTWNDIRLTFTERIMGLWRDSFQHLVLLLFLCGCMVVYIVKWRSIDPFLRTFTLMILLGSVVYTILWYKAYGDHDYYQLILVIPAVFVVTAALSYYSDSILLQTNKKSQYATDIVLMALMIMSVYHNQSVQIDRYSDKNSSWYNANVYEVEPYLRKIGITKDDIVLSVPDGSPNISLVAFGNKGYASDLFGKNNYTAAYGKKHGAKYMIITNREYIHDSNYIDYTTKLIGQYKDIYIFDMR